MSSSVTLHLTTMPHARSHYGLSAIRRAYFTTKHYIADLLPNQCPYSVNSWGWGLYVISLTDGRPIGENLSAKFESTSAVKTVMVYPWFASIRNPITGAVNFYAATPTFKVRQSPISKVKPQDTRYALISGIMLRGY